jgi:fido (protein-threonine AMPylation protein)
MPRKSAAGPAQWPEIFKSNSTTTKAVNRAVASGQLRPLGLGLYTSNLIEEAETILVRHRWRAVGLLAPGSVITYRTGLHLTPEPDGTVFLAGESRYERDLPGIKIRVVKGPGPQPGDFDMLPGLKVASRPRALLEALKPSRSHSGVARGVKTDEAERILENAFQSGGEQAVNRFRDAARGLAPALGAEREFAIVDQIAGIILGSRRGEITTPSAIARLGGEPYDVDRESLFQLLFAALRAHEAPERTMPEDDASFATAAFFDAYFSNFIEGTEFELAEARAIVFDGQIPAGRPTDANDVLGTYAVVGSRAAMSRSITTLPSFDAFVDDLRQTHRIMMGQRPDKRPGEFKQQGNRAGDTHFVAPGDALGTLRVGFDLVRALGRGFQRAAALMFVLSEVHPFDDGNGRVARAYMNAELVAERSARIIIPTVYRDEYLQGLRNLSRQRHADALVAVLDFAQRWTAAVDWRSFATAERQLTASHAFARSGSEVRLMLPRSGS